MRKPAYRIYYFDGFDWELRRACPGYKPGNSWTLSITTPVRYPAQDLDEVLAYHRGTLSARTLTRAGINLGNPGWIL